MQLGHAWDVVMSRATLLRVLRQQPAPSFPTPRVLGVDDFALRKRHTYGTILVDLERRQPVALLPERTAEPVAQWLREHPGVEVIARDRASAYAEGARHGALGATQVADRFHILQNLAEALTHVFTTYGRALDAVNATAHQQPVLLPNGTSAVPVPPPPTPPAEEARAAQRAARRQVRYDTVWALHRQGWSTTAIAVQVGCSCRTIERYLQMPTWPVRQHRRHYGRVSSIPIRYISWSAGTPGATPPSSSFRRSKRVGTPGAIAASRPMSAASARPRASHPAARAGASACRWWRSLSPSP